MWRASEELVERAGGEEMMNGRLFTLVWLWAFILLILFVGTAYGAGETESISAGMELPKFTLPGSESPEVQAYLGLKGSGSFTLPEVSGKIVLIDVVDVL
jgi:hypothetical protein